MADSKYRIAGYNSELAKKYPKVADLLEASGKDLSNTCYECLMLAMRIVGFEPTTRNEVREFLQVVKVYNKHNINPGVIGIIKANSQENVSTKAYQKEEKSKAPQIGWSDPAMEDDFID